MPGGAIKTLPPGTSRRSCLPASIHQELATATVIDPHPGAIPSPAVTLGAARVGHALDQLHAAAATYIDHAHLILVLVAVALQADRPVPARPRLPAAGTVSRAPIIRPPIPGRAEHAATATIHPQPLPVHAPTLAADARPPGFLLDQFRIPPRHVATVEPAIVAFAADDLPALRQRRRRSHPQAHADETGHNPRHAQV